MNYLIGVEGLVKCYMKKTKYIYDKHKKFMINQTKNC